MTPIIPSSLSPHICILTSPDLTDLLEASSLPPLPHILQSFSPLPQVTTRTTSLVSVPHSSFALRFSDLGEVEDACREDDEQRAVRTLDWMTERISKRSVKWVQEADRLGDKEGVRTPWWDELRRCAEGDFVPAKTEGWNHPVAVILAVSTTAPNPLQAITAMHSRNLQFPPWVDGNFLRYTLIIHPQNSPLTDEEAIALYNAVKKQFGLHSYLLSLTLPKAPPPPIPVPALMPRLPHPQAPTPPARLPTTRHPRLAESPREPERDIQQTARFTREFVVMSLVPWMEKCVVEWNENFSSTRRLPSRLFSSTRRLFGSPSPSPVPLPSASASVTSLPGRTSLSLPNGGPSPPSQQRRLAEFATILGDFKLAVMVWEALRKESKGGSDILPLLLTPSPTIPLHASAALVGIHPNMTELPPNAQVRALLYAAEEAPSALLLAQAALLSAKKQARRRAALWLEKCGIKPLTMYFLRKAQDLYSVRPPKELSPSFWDSEGKSPARRMLYTTGDVTGAVSLFLGLLRGASAFSSNQGLLPDGVAKPSGNDKLYLDDFRVAYSYFKSTDPDKVPGTALQLPIRLCVTSQLRVRFTGDGVDGDGAVWVARQEDWKAFWKARGGKEGIADGGKVCTNDLFWVDLVLRNPLDAEVNLSNLTLAVQELLASSEGPEDFIEVEVIKEVTLGPKETLTVPISLRSTRPTKFSLTHAKYDFLSLLPAKEPLASRGRRLHDTPLQRQQPTYAPDIITQVDVVPSDHKLTASYIEDERLVLLQGENKATRLWLTNAGSKAIGEVWLVTGPEDEIWVGKDDDFVNTTATMEVIQSRNSLKPQEPRRLTLMGSDQSSVLLPGDSVEVPLILHAEQPGSRELCFLLVYRESDTESFHSTKLTRTYEVQPLFDVSVKAEPSQSPDHFYVLDIDMTNVSPTVDVDIAQITALSPLWSCKALTESNLGVVAPSQCSRILLGASHSPQGSGSRETLDFVSRKLSDILQGKEPDTSAPPPIDVQCSHISKASKRRSMQGAAIMNFIHTGRRAFASRTITQVHPYISPPSHPSIFPLYNPSSVDFILFWEVPAQNRSGHVNVHGITLGAGHAALDGIIEEAESAKFKRSMYTETQRENLEVLDAIRGSEWNVEMNPVVLSMQDMGTEVHDFAQGPCPISLDVLLRNHSLTHPARYTLNLKSKSASSTNLLPLPYLGRLTFRGVIPPSQSATLHPKLWITRPGAYGLGGWTLETEIDTSTSDDPIRSSRKRRYLQEPPLVEGACLIVCDSRAP
ncbi:ER-golgi trafficking TRAPP I complex 85 kDa subunit-domain-containing protein [Crassisporium funariophilum]|nr:ER-golgi trafficking TRAPP I complex 85 kDa subunit-domain-containing protein [Crassisporium funariophilum]